MVSVTRPLYLEYVLGHPFGKVPPSRAFDGCTPTEAEVILTDPANPVGKTLLAALGYSTKVYFNACCRPSPLFDETLLLSSLPISLGPSHLADAMRNIIQLLVDFCVNPEEALNKLPTAAAKRGDVIVSSHSIPAPGKLSEFWIQLYNHISLLQCCENFVSAHPPSAPCLLCHPFERFAQSLEILEPEEEEEEEVLLSPLPLSHSSDAHLTSDLHLHESQEVEVQVLESGTSGLTSEAPLQQRPRGRGKGRKSSKQSEKQPQSPYSVYEEQSVVSDGEFEIPPLIEEHPGSEVIVSHSGYFGMDSDQVEASEAAQNLALLASQSVATCSSLPDISHHHHHDNMTDGPPAAWEVTVSLVNSVPASSSLASWGQSSSTVATGPSSPSAEQKVSSEIVAVAMSSVHESGNSLTTGVLPSSNVAEVSIVGVGTQTEPRPTTHDTAGLASIVHTPHTARKSTPESLRRSRRKITRVRRLVSEEYFSPDNDGVSDTNARPSAKRREVLADCRVGVGDVWSVPEDGGLSLPPAKRTRSKVVGRTTEMPVVGEGDEGCVVCESGWGHPTEWGVAEVGQFIAGIPHCSGFKDVFVEHLVDGETLLSLDPQMMVKLMDLKTGPALRIHRYISSLKKHFSLS
ncbi:Polyhomeotic-like protein 2 [Geodia barretti]|uniref:Polyhomeotic-like protein 2 n=1 Tax=Geodia barretti TaxID=519541 RepID=A0AA35XAI5_GEOBA|nr:Polyhomeotic-like protein 2 [Geodia barretti]